VELSTDQRIPQGAPLMHANHGHVFLIEPAPALAYQISSEDTRMLIDIPVDTPGTSAKYSTAHKMPARW
jgi:squalene monooxygenase